MATSIDPKVIESLPQNVLDTLPGGVPPPGYQALSPHPESLRTQTIVVGAVFLGIALVFFSVRAYVKLFMTKKLALEDYICTTGFALSIVQYAGITLAVTAGAGGYHMWDSSVGSLLSRSNIYANWLTTTFVTPALGFVKLTFLVQYYRLFWPLKWVRLSCWIGGAAAMAFYVAVTITMFILCSPWPHESWIASILSKHYASAQDLSIPTGTVGAAVDIFLLVLPIRAVISLQLAQRKKVALIFVFLTGALASIASIVGLAYRVENARNVADAEWGVANVWIWLQVEIFSGVAASCMPSLSKLLFDKDHKGWGLSSLTPRRLLSYLRSSRHSKSNLQGSSKRSTDSQETAFTKGSTSYLPKPSISSLNDPYFNRPQMAEVGLDPHLSTSASSYTYVSRNYSRSGDVWHDDSRTRSSQDPDRGVYMYQEVSVNRERPYEGDLEQGIDRRW